MTAPVRHLYILPLALGLVFFGASLTPTLIPRGWVVQGTLGPGLVLLEHNDASALRVASCPRACVAAPSAERTELSSACVSIARRHRHTAREQRARIARSRSRAAKLDMVTAVALAAVAARAADARSA